MVHSVTMVKSSVIGPRKGDHELACLLHCSVELEPALFESMGGQNVCFVSQVLSAVLLLAGEVGGRGALKELLAFGGDGVPRLGSSC
jgi:hypothetical protein